MAIELSDQDVAAFMAFFHRKPPYQLLGGGLYTYPDDMNPDKQRLWGACVALEQRGLLSRRDLGRGCVLFYAKESSDAPD
jgi:hypothetical protein